MKNLLLLLTNGRYNGNGNDPLEMGDYYSLSSMVGTNVLAQVTGR